MTRYPTRDSTVAQASKEGDGDIVKNLGFHMPMMVARVLAKHLHKKRMGV